MVMGTLGITNAVSDAVPWTPVYIVPTVQIRSLRHIVQIRSQREICLRPCSQEVGGSGLLPTSVGLPHAPSSPPGHSAFPAPPISCLLSPVIHETRSHYTILLVFSITGMKYSLFSLFREEKGGLSTQRHTSCCSRVSPGLLRPMMLLSCHLSAHRAVRAGQGEQGPGEPCAPAL